MNNFTLMISLLALSSIIFLSCSNKDSNFKENESDQKYFKNSYAESRNDFLKLSEEKVKAIKGARLGTLPLKTKKCPDCVIDYLYIPSAGNKLILITSGLHGIEGHVGSAVQRFFIDTYLDKIDLEKTGVLIIHGVNTWGFMNNRRYTENHVDLNRNCSSTPEIYSSNNPGYAKLYVFLAPKDKADTGSPGNRFFFFRSIYLIIKNGMGTLRQAIAQGQYEFTDGIFFGGKAIEKNISELSRLVKTTAAPYKAVFHIDFHTGFGERGKLHLFPNASNDKDYINTVNRIYKGFKIDWAETGGDFYTTSGDFTNYLKGELKNKYYISMPFEYGTMDSHTTIGSIETIKIAIIENQGYLHGYASPEVEAEIKKNYLEAFYPSSKGWRSEIIRQTGEVISSAIPEFINNF